MITLATAEKALKEVYLDVVSDQLNTTVNPLLARLEKPLGTSTAITSIN